MWLEWSNDLESYGKVVHLLVGCPMLDKKNYPGPPGWGFGHEANNLASLRNLTAEKPNSGAGWITVVKDLGKVIRTMISILLLGM